MHVLKCELLSHSLDPTIVALSKTREAQNAKLKGVWKATNTVKEANVELNLDLKFPSQPNKQRIGSGKFNPIHLKLLSAKADSFAC